MSPSNQQVLLCLLCSQVTPKKSAWAAVKCSQPFQRPPMAATIVAPAPMRRPLLKVRVVSRTRNFRCTPSPEVRSRTRPKSKITKRPTKSEPPLLPQCTYFIHIRQNFLPYTVQLYVFVGGFRLLLVWYSGAEEVLYQWRSSLVVFIHRYKKIKNKKTFVGPAQNMI